MRVSIPCCLSFLEHERRFQEQIHLQAGVVEFDRVPVFLKNLLGELLRVGKGLRESFAMIRAAADTIAMPAVRVIAAGIAAAFPFGMTTRYQCHCVTSKLNAVMRQRVRQIVPACDAKEAAQMFIKVLE